VGGGGVFLLSSQMNSEAYPANLSIGPVLIYGGGGDWLWHVAADHFRLVPRLEISVVIPLLILYTFIAWTGTNFTFTMCLVLTV